jgi:hypothetical protein
MLSAGQHLNRLFVDQVLYVTIPEREWSLHRRRPIYSGPISAHTKQTAYVRHPYRHAVQASADHRHRLTRWISDVLIPQTYHRFSQPLKALQPGASSIGPYDMGRAIRFLEHGCRVVLDDHATWASD